MRLTLELAAILLIAVGVQHVAYRQGKRDADRWHAAQSSIPVGKEVRAFHRALFYSLDFCNQTMWSSQEYGRIEGQSIRCSNLPMYGIGVLEQIIRNEQDVED